MENEYEALKINNQLCFPLYVVSKEIIRNYKPYLDEIDLTYTQYITMMIMWEHKEISVKGLGEYLFLDSGTLTPVLKTLEKKGYVKRERSQIDERSMIVYLTKKGEELKSDAVTIPSKMSGCIKLSQHDASELYRILHLIMEQCENN